jgi:uncharacterized membrane-anchored protein YjiN (DUF445 family)
MSSNENGGNVPKTKTKAELEEEMGGKIDEMKQKFVATPSEQHFLKDDFSGLHNYLTETWEATVRSAVQREADKLREEFKSIFDEYKKLRDEEVKNALKEIAEAFLTEYKEKMGKRKVTITFIPDAADDDWTILGNDRLKDLGLQKPKIFTPAAAAEAA